MIGLVSGLVVAIKDPQQAFKKMLHVKERHRPMNLKPDEYHFFCKSLLIVLKRRVPMTESEIEKVGAALGDIEEFMLDTKNPACIVI